MKIFLRILGALFLFALAIYFSGYAIPAQQTHTRTIALKQTPEAVFALLSDLPSFPKWNRNTVKVEMLPPLDGKEVTRQTFKGDMQMTIVTAESIPPTHLVRALGDARSPFEGAWTYEISRTPTGCEVVLTEQSSISNPIFRLMTKLFGPTKYIDEHLEDIAKHFGETATIR